MSFFSKKKRIYADWAATTPIHPKVRRAMRKAAKEWANPSAIYAEGVRARKMLEEGRARSARLLGVKPEEIYFTSGGTEANATIIQGILRTVLEKKLDPGIRRDAKPTKDKGSENSGNKAFLRPGEGRDPGSVHVVTTSIEHSSILETLRIFEQHGVKVTYVNPGPDGVVRADNILAAITPKTALVTVMYANNEIGTIQPVSKIGAGIRKLRAEGHLKHAEGALQHYPVFHTDASQAPLWLSCELEGLRADAMTLDAHKMQGPKGVGALIVRRHVNFEPLMAGGGQERGKRPTTESLELVSGFAEALSLAQEGRGPRAERAAQTRDLFFKLISKELPQAIVNGSLEKRLPNNVNISLPNISDPELAVLYLNHAGIACSTKSSCLKGEKDSYVVKSLGGESWGARNTLRFTLAPDVSMKDVIAIVEALKNFPKT